MLISGWGALSEGGGSPNILNVAFVPLITQAECQERYRRYGYDITDDMVCAAFTAGELLLLLFAGESNPELEGSQFGFNEATQRQGLVTWGLCQGEKSLFSTHAL